VGELLSILGTFAFAISGFRLASLKGFDLFGVYIVGLVTAIAGGTLRDLLLNVKPFFMVDESYLYITGISLIIFAFFKDLINRLASTIFLFDAIGLGFFTIIGVEKGLLFGCSPFISVVLGVITGAFGGIVRDILINEEPLILKKDIYALASFLGGICYCALLTSALPGWVAQLSSSAVIVLARIISQRFHLQLPKI
jgi:uncharacterized membrane protein YeiH